MRNPIVDNELSSEEMREKSQRINQEICHRFVRLSCHKMISSKGCSNLRRNLLILHLLQKARKDMKQVPDECKCLLESDQVIQPPKITTAMRRSGSPRSGSPISRKPLLGRSFQLQQTTPKRWPFNAAQQTTTTSPLGSQQQRPTQTSLPLTPPPADENVKSSNPFTLSYQTIDHDDDVFVDEEKENKKSNTEDVEELFLQKVGKSFISPPVSPEKPIQKLLEIAEDQSADRQLKLKNRASAGRRLEFLLPDLRNSSGRRDFFGILLPDSKSAPEVLALSDTLTGQIQSAPIQLNSLDQKCKFGSEQEVNDLPPYLFCCDKPVETTGETKISAIENLIDSKSGDRIVPTRLNRSSVSLCLDFGDSKLIENEDYYTTDGECYTEEEDELDFNEFGHRFPSFKRRLRKRKPVAGVRNAAFFYLAEKRIKDAPDLLMLAGRSGMAGSHKQKDEHCVPSIFI